MENQIQYLLKTKKQPCAVEFRITTNGTEVPIYVIGYDPLIQNTYYFKSQFIISGAETITMNLPQSPHLLKIIIWSGNSYPFEIASTKVVPMDRPEPDEIVGFIERFSRMAGFRRPGIYAGKGVPFILEYLLVIKNDDGSEHPTPARIHVSKPVIQASKHKFDQMSIPERVIVLLHEVSHNFINADQDSELESDQNGLVIYNQLGYPKIEAVNAFATIMADTDENYERMLNLLRM